MPQRLSVLRPCRAVVLLAISALVSAYAPATPATRQWIDIRNVDLHLNEHITLRVRYVHGEVFRTNYASLARAP
jgi:hypothetical protein